jgi:hypothetical protein
MQKITSTVEQGKIEMKKKKKKKTKTDSISGQMNE